MGIGNRHPQAWRIEILDRGQKVDERNPLAFHYGADLGRNVGKRVGLELAQLGNVEHDKKRSDLACQRGEGGKGLLRLDPAGGRDGVEVAVVVLPIRLDAELATQRIE